MPYVSKYFNCEEIDERLKQGYYDDFVAAGFVGTLQEFLTFVLSLKDKINKEDSNEAIKTATELIEQEINTLKSSIPIRVSDLENDSKYQTQDDVERYINKLVNGAGEALDTLEELAKALGDDPNFATNITNLITSVKTALEEEITRATEKEEELRTAIVNEHDNRVKADNDIRELIESNRTSITDTLQNAYNALDTKIDTFNQKVIDLTKELSDVRTEVSNNTNSIKEELLGKITEESTSRKDADQLIRETISNHKIEATNQITEIKNQVVDLKTKVDNEATIRQTEDSKLQSAINEESSKRASDKVEVLGKVSEEVANRTSSYSELLSKINDEISDREVADQELKSQMDAEVTNRVNADNLINQTITHNKELSDAAIKKVADDLASEVSRATELEDSKVSKKAGYDLSKNDFTDELLAKLNSIDAYANNITKVSELVNDSGFQTKEQVNKAIEDIIGGAPDVLNTLKELSDALGNDPNFATTLTNNLSQLGTQINQEIQDRKESDEVIKVAYVQAIQNEAIKLQAAIDVLAGTVNSNQAILESSVDEVKEDLNDLESAVTGNLDDHSTKITDLRSDLVQKFNELNTAITNINSSVEAKLLSQDGLIRDNTQAIQENLKLIQGIQKQYNEISGDFTAIIESEAQIRKASDDAIKSDLELVKQDLTYEASERVQADNLLDTKISNEVTRAKLAEKTNADNLTEEISRAQVAERSLLNDLAAETFNREESVNEINGKITQINDALLNTYATKEEVDTRISEIIGTAPEALDTLGEIADALNEGSEAIDAINGVLAGKASTESVEALVQALNEEKAARAALQAELNTFKGQVALAFGDTYRIVGLDTEESLTNQKR